MPFTLLFHFLDPLVEESSGVAVDKGVYFTFNDSGDTARFFAVDRFGRTIATYAVDNATNVDWEDMAITPARAGHPATLWFADIGDNRAARPYVTVYAVPEPRVSPGTHGVRASAAFRFRYPDGPRDAETLLVDPATARITIVSKSWSGNSTIYVAPEKLSRNSVNELTAAGKLSFGFGDPATGGAVSADGRQVVIRTYIRALLWPVPHGDIAAALQATPTTVSLPAQHQGEGVAFAGNRLVVTSEGLRSPVYAVTLPAAATPSPSTSPAVSPSGFRATTPAAAATARRTSRAGSKHVGLAVGLAALVIAATAGGTRWHRRRRRPR